MADGFKLVSTAGDQSIDVKPGVTLIVGRAVNSDVPIYDPTISRQHAQLSAEAGGVHVKDLGSSNGTFLNGSKVTDTVAAPNDVLTFGKVAFYVREHAKPSGQPKEAPGGFGAPKPAGATIVRQLPVGEVSAAMLKDVGCRCVILGHSERRHVLGERDELIRAKVKAALAAGLDPILCVGETLEERDANRMLAVVERQVREGLSGTTAEAARRVTVAYEPVWAIGTGRNATPEQAQEAHAAIRKLLAALFGKDVAEAIRNQYGGSVKPDNARAIISQPDVDGALVGGASLKADSFLDIARAAK